VTGGACEAEARDVPYVWVFHGEHAQFASGVFADQDAALAWAAAHELSGVLTRYPVGVGCYDYAVAQNRFVPSKPHHGTPEHVARFSPGGPHIHLRDGVVA
jgi:hypothetical protein